MKTHRTLTNIASDSSGNSVYTILTKSWFALNLVILTFPVAQGCSKHEHPRDSDFTEAGTKSSVKLAVRQTEDAQIRSLEAFVFNDDALKRIECYQRTEKPDVDEWSVGSCSGSKIVLLCANAPWEKKNWKDVSSFRKASSVRVDLEDEDEKYPIMSTTTHIKAGEASETTLERLTSEVELRSIHCDFTGKPYEGEEITEARAYLINVSGTCSIVPEDEDPIERIINHGSLIQDDITRFINLFSIADSIGTIRFSHTYPGIRLLCYPNMSEEESIGTPFTRLVIEGKIQGETWYWPISVNRNCGNGHEGIRRNMRYVYDITIRSKGTKDPDIPIVPEMAETILETRKWKEKEPYHVAF